MKLAKAVALVGVLLSSGSVAAQNACENKDDLFHWRKLGGFFIFRDILQFCTIKFLGQTDEPTFNEDFASCIKAQGLPYKFDCRVCFAQVASCTDDLCIETCLIQGTTSPECEECAETQCDPVFEQCAGTQMSLSECIGCSEPLGTIFYFMPDEVTYAVAALLIVLILLLLYKCMPRPKDDVEEAYPEDNSSIAKRKESSNLSRNRNKNLMNNHNYVQLMDARTALPSALGSQWVKMDEEEPFPDGASLLEQRLPSVSSLGKHNNNSRVNSHQRKPSSKLSGGKKMPVHEIDFDAFTESPHLFDSKRVLPEIDPMAATQITSSAKDLDFDEIEGLKPPSTPSRSNNPRESL